MLTGGSLTGVMILMLNESYVAHLTIYTLDGQNAVVAIILQQTTAGNLTVYQSYIK